MSAGEIAAKIGATGVALAAVVYAAAKLSEWRHPPTGRIIDVDGTRVHYAERGSGPPVVLLHGNTTMLQDMMSSGLVDSLARRHRVIVIDRPGFGYSERPRRGIWMADRQAGLVAGAMAKLGIASATVVGHSWGALVALALAEREPARVEALALLSGFYFPESRVDVAMAAPVATPVLGDVLRYTLTPALALLLMPLTLRAMFGPPAVPRRFRQAVPVSMMLRPWQIRAATEDGSLMIPSAAVLRPGYSELRLPVHIVAGTDDRVVDCERHSVRLSRAVPGSSIDLIEGGGHMIHHQAPDRIAAGIEALATAGAHRRAHA